MLKYFRNILIAGLGLGLLSAPLAASAAPTGYVRAGGGYHAGAAWGGHYGGWHGAPVYGGYHPGYGYRAGYGYYRPGYGYYRPGFGYYRPYGYAGYYPNGWYGVAPYGWYGYYWIGGWYHSRRWSGGVWIYF